MKNNLSIKRKRPQAMAEMVVILIPMLIIFMGLWYVSAVGKDRIQLYVNARGEAELFASNTAGTPFTDAIQDWDRGRDGLMFTADDNPIYGVDYFYSFGPQMTQGSINPNDIDQYLEFNVSQNIASPVFAVGADLVQYKGSKQTFSTQGNDRAQLLKTFQTLFGVDAGETITEEVYIPAMSKDL